MNENTPKKIGEGSYGCVHKPNLKCKYQNKTLKNHVSKFMETSDALSELNEYKIIDKIDKNKHYFLGKPTLCIPANNKTNKRAIQKCDMFKKNCSLKDYSLLVMKDGGKELSEFSKKTIQELKKNKTSVNFIKKFFLEIKNLFRGVMLFEENGYSHHDLKPQNIVYNINTNTMKFIDFGFMRKQHVIIDECKHSAFKIADYPFWCYPFEFPYMNKEDYMKILTMSEIKKLEYYKDWIQQIYSKKESKLSISMIIFFNYITKYKNETEKKLITEKYFENFKHMLLYEMIPDKYNEFIKKSVKTLDVFGLGMTLIFLLNYCKPFINQSIFDLLETCFFQMTNPSVFNRLTIQDAYSKYENILKNKWNNQNTSHTKYTSKHFSNSFQNKTKKNKLFFTKHKKNTNKLIQKSEKILSKYKTST